MKVGLLVKLLFDYNIWIVDKYENLVLKKIKIFKKI